jgi:catechol 2,3-dioxygenase-like lactoylglutathione lyase family enzyme
MLDHLAAITVLPASDLGRARTFYHDKLGLDPSTEKPGMLEYSGPSGTTFELYETPNAGTAKNTQMCWMTSDLAAEMAEMRGHGVVFEDYDFPGLKTDNGVAEVGNERSAWFMDSEGNTLCVAQSMSS